MDGLFETICWYFITDTYGTAVGVINPDAPYKVVIEGHADEISWYVNYINDEGMDYVIRNGGSDHKSSKKEWTFILKKRNCKGVLDGLPFKNAR
jgi:putative aminopeptidase FrvX